MNVNFGGNCFLFYSQELNITHKLPGTHKRSPLPTPISPLGFLAKELVFNESNSLSVSFSSSECNKKY